MMPSPISKEPVPPRSFDKHMELSGISSCDVSAILSAGEMDDKSLQGNLADL